MKTFERLTHGGTFRSGIVGAADMMVLALSSASARRVGLAALAATVVGIPSATAAAPAENNLQVRCLLSTPRPSGSTRSR
jgi:hypothetical protein